MISGLVKIKNGVQKYFRLSAEDSGEQKFQSESESDFSKYRRQKLRRKVKEKKPVARSSFYVEVPTPETEEDADDLEPEVTVPRQDSHTSNGNSFMVDTTQTPVRALDKPISRRRTTPVYENVDIGGLAPKSGESFSMGHHGAPQQNSQNRGEALPPPIWNHRGQQRPRAQTFSFGNSQAANNPKNKSNIYCNWVLPHQRKDIEFGSPKKSKNTKESHWDLVGELGIRQSDSNQHGVLFQEATKRKSLISQCDNVDGNGELPHYYLYPGFIPVTEL